MNAFPRHLSARYRAACVFDALLPPILFLAWYWQTVPEALVAGAGTAHHRPGLFFDAIMMFIVGRAVLRLETAIRMPWAYRWDWERALRVGIVILAMGMAIRFL